MSSHVSPGQALAATLADSLKAYQVGPVFGGQERQIIDGVTPDGSFVGGMTHDAFSSRAIQILRDNGRFYRYGNTTVYETNTPGDQRLTTLAVQHRADPTAAAVLANLLGVGCETKQGTVQSLVPSKLIAALMADEALWSRLPEIKHHARRPTFDADFNLCSPGWNAGSGILVHAPEVVPWSDFPAHAPDVGAIDRLPPCLRGLLREFYWQSDADSTNALAMLLTGLLINHFVDDPHPGGIVDANQSGLGKTLLVQVIGKVLDNTEPPRIALKRDEELEKQLCAQLRSSRSSLFFFDNIRNRVESAVLEQNMLSPLLSFRVLGRSANFERPNTHLWFITSNKTAATTDLIRRCVPIRQSYDGDPKARVFQGDPVEYAIQHRTEILGELAGMVLLWRQRGGSLGLQKHRCVRWAATIGGILDACSLGQFFLANVEEAEGAMDQELQDLANLAEHVSARGPANLLASAGHDPAAKGWSPGQWPPLFAEAQVLRDRLAEGSPRAKATTIGQYLSTKVDRTVLIEAADGPRRMTLRRRKGPAQQNFYYFETSTAHDDDAQVGQQAATQPSGVATPDAEHPGTTQIVTGMDPDESTRGPAPPHGPPVAPDDRDHPSSGPPEWT